MSLKSALIRTVINMLKFKIQQLLEDKVWRWVFASTAKQRVHSRIQDIKSNLCVQTLYIYSIRQE